MVLRFFIHLDGSIQTGDNTSSHRPVRRYHRPDTLPDVRAGRPWSDLVIYDSPGDTLGFRTDTNRTLHYPL